MQALSWRDVRLLGLVLGLLALSTLGTCEDGPQVEALAWRQVTYTGDGDGAAYGGRLAVDFPLRLSHLPLGRMWTRLDLAGAPGELANFADPTAFGKRLEVGIGWYVPIGRIGHVVPDDEATEEDESEGSWLVSTNLFVEGGWATVTTAQGEGSERIEDRYLRHAVAGLLVVESHSGGYIGVGIGRHELGGVGGGRIQAFVIAQMPLPKTKGALVIGGTAVLNGDVRDVARIYVAADLFAVLGKE